jgi:hypothetical protein
MYFRFNTILIFFITSSLVAEGKINFDRDIRPIISDNCVHCHGPDANTREAKLRLDTFEGSTAKRKHGAAVVPGQPLNSQMIQRMITTDEDDVMPPADSHLKVSKEQIELIKQWIAEGAEWSEHWAFVKPVRPTVPVIAKNWALNPIDNFIYTQLQKKKLTPAPEASKRTLLRRLSLDLTGLPPTPAEMTIFLADNAKGAYKKAVERLLASPHYGERMAWPWLDAARYSDTNGYQNDPTRTMWPWRDWVIKAFNDNMPFDQFTIEQIAGDMLPKVTQSQKLATAFLRNHMINGEGGRIPEENRIEYVFDQLETVGTTWLGLTFYCCRCHDHKYDPISQKDYYSFSAFFNQTPVTGRDKSGAVKPTITIAAPKSLTAPLADKITSLENDLTTITTKLLTQFQSQNPPLKIKKEQYFKKNKDFNRLSKEITKLKRQLAKLGTRVMVMEENQKRKTYILNTGMYNQHEAEVTANVPAVLPPLPKGSTANRLALAKWLVSEDNPLTARVTINRLWAQIFGMGITKTTENFGIQGERPVNDKLLDWLATEFIRSKWDFKHMVRLMVSSATYRQSSHFTKEKLAMDPYNRLHAHGARYRMPSWMIRDQALAASGLLNKERGGAGVYPYQPPGVWSEMTFGKIRYKTDKGNNLYKRSIYTFWRRIVSPTIFFDIAKRQTCEVKDKRTNTPLHALVILNDKTYVEAGRALAVKVFEEKNSTVESRIHKMYSYILGRSASDKEMVIVTASLNKLIEKFKLNPKLADEYLQVGQFRIPEKMNKSQLAAYANLALMLLNLDESVTRE